MLQRTVDEGSGTHGNGGRIADRADTAGDAPHQQRNQSEDAGSVSARRGGGDSDGGRSSSSDKCRGGIRSTAQGMADQTGSRNVDVGNAQGGSAQAAAGRD